MSEQISVSSTEAGAQEMLSVMPMERAMSEAFYNLANPTSRQALKDTFKVDDTQINQAARNAGELTKQEWLKAKESNPAIIIQERLRQIIDSGKVTHGDQVFIVQEAVKKVAERVNRWKRETSAARLAKRSPTYDLAVPNFLSSYASPNQGDEKVLAFFASGGKVGSALSSGEVIYLTRDTAIEVLKSLGALNEKDDFEVLARAATLAKHDHNDDLMNLKTNIPGVDVIVNKSHIVRASRFPIDLHFSPEVVQKSLT